MGIDMEKKSALPRGLRNNNPGNIRLSRTVWIGEIRPSQDKEFCQFSSMSYGYRALMKLLQNYRRKHGCQTIADMIRRWAPPSENNTSGYIVDVCRQMQVPSSFVVDINDEDSMCALSAAISRHENGVEAVMSDVHAGWLMLNGKDVRAR